MKNSKQTLVFNFNNAVTAEHVHGDGDDDDESSEVLIGKKSYSHNSVPSYNAAVDFIYVN